MKRYAIIIEQGPTNYAGYVPDLPICFTTGASPEEVEANLQEAIEAHLDALKELGMPIPEPTAPAPNDLFVEVTEGPGAQAGAAGN